jgi:malto-oligosyltrehalose trehalohydrolase
MTIAASGRFGPLALEQGYRLRLYAPAARRVELLIDGRTLPMERRGDWFALDDPHARAGSRYAFAADGGRPIPDPGSRFQPEGVHEPSEIAASHFVWPDDGWRGRPWHEHVIYELHVGAFTFDGTYESAGRKLRDLVALGITAIELMPIAAFPGARNWGYDGVLPYAPYAGYGKPDDLRRFIAAAHAHGLAVLLDVVYNHFGPEGNYLHTIAPTFFNDAATTPWGAAIDVSVPDVRAFFAENAAYWLSEFRFDGLRLDATHAIVDPRAPSFMNEVRTTALAACEPDRQVALVVENDLNDVALLDEGYDAQWNDDVHHCAHVIATGETGGYYRDYAGDPAGWLGRALATGFAFQGEISEHRDGKPRGSPSARFPLSAFVSFLQNHDQIGNRAFGERLAFLAAPEALRALTALILLAPAPPLLFMGEEWAASTPFLFFCDFERGLAKLVTEGRRREFTAFPQFSDPSVRATIPDPAAVTTFEASRLRWEERDGPRHAAALAFTTALLHARARNVTPFVANVRGTDAVCERIGTTGLALRWKLANGMLHADANLSGEALDGFPERVPGEPFYALHDAVYRGGRAPAWAVRWSRT